MIIYLVLPLLAVNYVFGEESFNLKIDKQRTYEMIREITKNKSSWHSTLYVPAAKGSLAIKPYNIEYDGFKFWIPGNLSEDKSQKSVKKYSGGNVSVILSGSINMDTNKALSKTIGAKGGIFIDYMTDVYTKTVYDYEKELKTVGLGNLTDYQWGRACLRIMDTPVGSINSFKVLIGEHAIWVVAQREERHEGKCNQVVMGTVFRDDYYSHGFSVAIANTTEGETVQIDKYLCGGR